MANANINLDDLSEISASELAAQDAAIRVELRKSSEAKKALVLKWLGANSAKGAREMVEKFDLDFRCEKEFDNGLCVVGFYTGVDQNCKIGEIRDAASNWFTR